MAVGRAQDAARARPDCWSSGGFGRLAFDSTQDLLDRLTGAPVCRLPPRCSMTSVTNRVPQRPACRAQQPRLWSYQYRRFTSARTSEAVNSFQGLDMTVSFE
jgi:hypothetical protein